MDLNELLESKIKTGIQVEFSTAKTKKGEVMVLTDPKSKRYIIHASVEDYNRFVKWDGRSATVDIKRTGKLLRTTEYGFLPVVNIRADVTLEPEQPKEKAQEKKEPETVF